MSIQRLSVCPYRTIILLPKNQFPGSEHNIIVRWTRDGDKSPLPICAATSNKIDTA
jgi:hypothetical protein